MTAPRFQIGDKVFYAQAYSISGIDVPCPVCYGKKTVDVILGNGEIQTLDCGACDHCLEGSRGYVKDFGVTSSVVSGEISLVGKDQFNGGWRYEVNGHWSEDIFLTEAEAEARREMLHKQCESQNEDRSDAIQKNKKKSMLWGIRYHKDCLKRAQRDVEYHSKKLHLLEAKAEAKSRKAVG